MVHRDLKPSNILLNENMHVVLADFGTAKCLNSKSSNISSSTNASAVSLNSIKQEPKVQCPSTPCSPMSKQEKIDQLKEEQSQFFSGALPEESRPSLVGTPEYIAPEVVDGQDATFSADLWAIGIILYELITGKRLFKGANESDTFDKILECNLDCSLV